MNNGFINFNKAAGMTSHDAVNFLRKIFQTKKVGHGGTLDPSATGILPIAVGRATSISGIISNVIVIVAVRQCCSGIERAVAVAVRTDLPAFCAYRGTVVCDCR